MLKLQNLADCSAAANIQFINSNRFSDKIIDKSKQIHCKISLITWSSIKKCEITFMAQYSTIIRSEVVVKHRFGQTPKPIFVIRNIGSI